MTGERSADDHREESIRKYHAPHWDKWGDKAPDYCADCFLLLRIDEARPKVTTTPDHTRFGPNY